MSLGISDAVTLSGRVLDLVKAGVTMDLQERVMELRAAVLNAQEEILRLREELAESKRVAAEREQLKFDGMVYWREIPGHEKEGPFCQRCYDFTSKLTRLHECPSGIAYHWGCACGFLFGPKEQDRDPVYRAFK